MGHTGRTASVARAVCAVGVVVTFSAVALARPAGATPPPTSPATVTDEWGSGAKQPDVVKGVTGEVGVDAGNYGAVVREADGSVEGWGQSWAPRGVSTLPRLAHVVGMADGNDDYAFLEAPTGISPGVCPSGTSVWTVGLNLGSDLGIGDSSRDTYTTPQEVTALDGLGVVQVVAASGHMLALTCRGDVYVWGSNGEDVLAMPPNEHDFAKPVLNPTLTKLTRGTSVGVELTTGSFSADLLVDGRAYGWGNNNLGQCGCGSSARAVDTPTAVLQDGVAFTSIDGGGDLVDNGHTLALDSHGHAYCWGDSQQGQCGLGTTGIVRSPTRVPGLPTLAQALAGGQYSLFLTTGGSVWTCGDNAKGQIGNGTTTNQLTPVSVLQKITMISAGAGHALAAG